MENKKREKRSNKLYLGPKGTWIIGYHNADRKRIKEDTGTSLKGVASQLLRNRERESAGLSWLRVVEEQEEASPSKKAEPQARCYFIRAGVYGPIKIGASLDPEERLADLQTAHYEELSIIGTVAGGFAKETELQRRFEHLKIRREWYRPEPELTTAIAEMLSAGL